MPPERKARWKREIDWLLSVTDYIVEFVPIKQKSKDGIEMEVIREISFAYSLPSSNLLEPHL